MAGDAWLDPLRRELDAAAAPVTVSFRDDDAGWEDERLLALLDLFAGHAVPLDLAVIPAALGRALADELVARHDARPGLLALHQHGFAHANHEPEGRPCEFGPSRPADAQRRDLEAGARRLAALVGRTAPIFTPPWNRCTRATGRCLRELGFRAVARDAGAEPLRVDGLRELHVHVDWSRRRNGRPGGRAEVSDRLAAAVREHGSAAVMLHHAVMGRADRAALEPLLELVASHPSARCRPLASLLPSG